MRKLSIYSKEKSKGQAMVEFALALPVLLLLLYGMMETGRLLFIYASTVSAARQAVRYGSATGIGPSGDPYYQDCNGIEASARRLGFINRFQTVTIAYDNGIDSATGAPRTFNPNPACGAFVTAQNGDRVIVEVTSQWQPIVSIVPFEPFTITSRSERTILVSVDIAVTAVSGGLSGTSGTPQLTITASPATYSVLNEVITYTYKITNIGSGTLTGPFTIIDPNSKVTITCPTSPANLAANATYTCTGTYSITQPNLDSGSVTNTGSSTPSGASTSKSLTISAVQNGLLTLTKTPSTTLATTNANVTYTYSLKNNGNVTLTTYAITDDKLGSICSGASIASGATVTCTKTYTVTAIDTAAGSIVNIATATGSYTSPTLGAQSVIATATAKVTTAPIALSVLGELISGTSPYTSEKIKYTYSVKNNTLSSVTLTSISVGTFTGLGIKPTVTCSMPIAIAAGATKTCDFTYYNVILGDLDNVNTTTGVGIPVYIQATATAGGYTSVTDLYPVDVYRVPALTLTASTTIPPSNTSPAVTTTTGGIITYTYTITNTGNVTLSPPINFEVTDTQITTGITCDTPAATIAPGTTKICNASREILQADIDNGSVVGTANTAALFGITSYPATAQSLIITSSIARLKLEITTPLPSVIGAGVDIVYSYILTNTGNAALTTVTDATPYDFITGYKGTYPSCADSSLAIGESTTCTGTYKTKSTDKGTDVVNTTVGNAYTIANLKVISNSASVAVSVATPSFCSVTHGTLQISPTFGMTLVNNNDFEIEIDSIKITYNDNPNNQQITQLTLGSNPLWSVSNQTMGGYYEFLPAVYTGPYIIPANTSYLLSVTGWKATYAAAAPSIEKIVVSFTDTNCADLDSGVTVTPPTADLQITKTDLVTTVDIGGSTIYTIRVTNGGPSSITAAKLSDPVVTGLSKTAIACSATPGQCTVATTPTIAQIQAGNFTLPTLASGQFYEITVNTSVTATTAGSTLSNTAIIAIPTGATDPTPGNNSATDTNTLAAPSADFAVTKTNGDTTLGAGANTTYVIRVTNNSGSTISGAKLTDAAATGLNKTSILCSSTPGQCVTAPTITQLQAGASLPTIASGQFYEITVAANATALSGSVSNIATISLPTGATDTVPGNNSATDTDTITNPIADLSITKSNGGGSIVSGSPTTYTIRVTNGGGSATTGAILTDIAATGLSKTSVACSATPGQCAAAPTVTQLQSGTFALPALASGQFYEITVTADVTAVSGNVSNTATVAAPAGTSDPSTGNNSATDTDSVTVPTVDLAITKTNGAATVGASTNTTYTIRVTNSGPSSVTGAILSDIAATGLSKTSVACSATPGQCTAAPTVTQLQSGTFALPALTSGQFYEITVLTSVTAVNGNVTNTATIAVPSGTTDSAGGNNSAADTDTVTPAANLSITKTDGTASVNTNGTTTYTIRVTNGGPSSVTGAILSDVAAIGLSKTSVACSAAVGNKCLTVPTVNQLQSGTFALPALTSTQFYEITVLTSVTATSGSVDNTATVAAPSGTTDPTTANNTATDTNAVIPFADLAITKTDGTTSVNAGGTTTYTIRVTNGGPSPVTGAILSDIAATGLSKTSVACSATPGQCATAPTVTQLQAGTFALPALTSGQFYEITVLTSVNATSGSVTNTATIAVPSGTTDSGAGNNSAADINTVTPVADLSISKTNGVASINANGTTTYTIRVTNGGPSTVTGAILSDIAATGLSKTSVACSATPGQCVTAPTVTQLQAGTFALPAITSGQFYEITVLTSVTATSGNVTNTATIAVPSGTTDGSAGNNSAADTDAVTVSADLSITKTNGVASVSGSGTTTYTIRVTNGGPSTVTGAILSDIAATGLSKTSVVCSATPGQCVTAPTVTQLQAGTFALPAITSGQFYEITVLTSVTATSGSVTNVATIAAPSGATDPSPANNTATEIDTVTAASVCAAGGLTLTAPGTLSGTTIYTWEINNATGVPLHITGISATFTSAASKSKLLKIYMPDTTQILVPDSLTPYSIIGQNFTVNIDSALNVGTTFKLTFDIKTTVTDLTLTFSEAGCGVSNP